MKSDSYYLDYNATSPLVKPVLDYLAKGDLPFANPASSHKLGKQSKKIINNSSQKIKEALSVKDFHIFYHSGATEGINTIFNLNKEDAFFYFTSDHPAVTSVAEALRSKGVSVHAFKVNSDGQFDLAEIISKINSINVIGHKWFNFMFAHNETGVVWDLDLALKIKSKCDVKIHVDAVQSISKIKNFQKLRNELDAYTFSSHKFGGPKSFGFSLLKNKSDIQALILGGAQQENLRSGTENPSAIEMTWIALEHHLESDKFDKAISFRKKLEDLFTAHSSFKVVAQNESRTCNTIRLICSADKNDIMLTKFDMNGFYISKGSACSSGSTLASQTILDMGFKKESENFLRISFSPLMTFDQEALLLKLGSFLKSV